MRIRLLGQGSPLKLVKAHGNAELAKGPRKPKESERAKNTQGKDERDIGAHKEEKPVVIPSHWEKE